MTKPKHASRKQRLRWLSGTRGTLLGVIAGSVVVAGVGLGIGAAVSTSTTLNGGDSTTVTCASASSKSATVTRPAKLTVRIACTAKPVPTTTTTKPPVTTTTLPPTTTTRPPATTTTTAAPPATTTTTAPPGGQVCVTGAGTNGADNGLPVNGAYYDPADINASNGFNTYVNNQIEDGQTGFSDKLCGTSPSSWNLTWTQPDASDGGAVMGYVNTQQLYNNEGSDGQQPTPITPGAGTTSITSTFNATNPSDSIGQWEMAYDLWFGIHPVDVMIWENTSTARNADDGNAMLNPNVTIDGVAFSLEAYCNGGSTCNLSGGTTELMLVRHTNVNSGTENILADVQWLQANGYLPAGDGLTQVNFGWEICDTDSQLLTMAVNGYTLTRTPNPS